MAPSTFKGLFGEGRAEKVLSCICHAVNIKGSFGLLSAFSRMLGGARRHSTADLALLFRSQKSGFDFVLAETDLASEILLEA